jgi:glycosyltransferase involved in cell wall biosynthesis
MKVALVYDRVNKFGGAERVLLSLHKIFPEAPLFTLVYKPKTSSWANVFKVRATFLNSFLFFRNRHELLAPLAPMAFEALDLSGFDVVISITSSDAKAVVTKPGQLHVCYCLTPTRYYWSGTGEYKKDWKLKITPQWLLSYFRTVDLLISKRPDKYIAISNEVKERIKKYYHRESSVIYPSIEDKFYPKKLVSSLDRMYYLVVSRLVPYKKVDLAISAFNKLNKPLIIVGTGSEYSRLKKMSGPNIKFVGGINDTQLIDYYSHAKAVIFPQEEDFGLVPIEAQACGTPVIAFGQGGALETVVDKKTGVFFSFQNVKSLSLAVLKFEKMNISPRDCNKNALRFNEKSFIDIFSSKIKSFCLDYFTDSST